MRALLLLAGALLTAPAFAQCEYLTLSVTHDGPVCPGETTTLTATSNAAQPHYTWSWDGGVREPVFMTRRTGGVGVTVRDLATDCTKVANAYIENKYVPYPASDP